MHPRSLPFSSIRLPRYMPVRPLLALVVLGATVACAPIVTHGPIPERGLQLTATAGLPYPLCGVECEINLFNQVGFGARYGRPAENGKPGYSVGGTLSLGVMSSELDVYVQAPTGSDWSPGGGVLLSPMHVMPYAQAGRMRANGSGFYTTQGIVWMPERSDAYWMDYETRAYVKPLYWAPTIAYRLARRRSALHLYVSGGLGTMTLREASWQPEQPPVPDRAPLRFISAGVSVEYTFPQPIMVGPRPEPRRIP
jgi:hypothetical protein